MFATRLKSGIILLAITIALLIYGGQPMFWGITLITLVGLFELYRTVNMEKTVPAVIGFAASIALDYFLLNDKWDYIVMTMIFGMILMLACYVIKYPKYNSEQMTMLVFGLLYVTTMLSFVFKVRNMKDGVILVWLIFIGAWGSDTCAYCVGKLIGKHKLPSKLSPNKTIEGCIGGIIGAGLSGLIYAMIMYKNINMGLEFLAIGMIAAVISQIGDLTASAIKRNHDVKDYGKLIPGHGGILDRFDSIIFIAPLVYYLLLFFHK